MQTGHIVIETVPAEATAIKIIPKPYIPLVAGMKTSVIASVVDKFGLPILNANTEIELTINGPALLMNGSKTIKSKLVNGKAEIDIEYTAAGEVTIVAEEKNGLKGRMKVLVK